MKSGNDWGLSDMSFENNTEILIYQTEDGQTKVDVRIEDETVWLSQPQIVELLQSSKANVSEHIKHIFDEGELSENAVVRNFRTTATDGKKYNVKYYNLDVIISVGYRVKSHRGTQFRIWATQRLKEYIVKGFTMNDDLLKKAGGGHYFKELLERIRDIRSSEKVFYRQVLDIYATSIDYSPEAEITKKFFKTVQNKMHFAVHGYTAAEMIYLRVNAEEQFLGMTAFEGKNPKKSDVSIAKNYLNEDELNILNRLVSAYLELAELQAIKQKPMYMEDWMQKLDEFLKISGSNLLENAGKISHEQAKIKAELEFEKYREKTKDEPSKVEKDFLESIKAAQKELEEKR